MKPILYLCILVLSSSVFATRTCPPSGNCGLTVEDMQPTFYPSKNLNNRPSNPEVDTTEEPPTSSPDTN